MPIQTLILSGGLGTRLNEFVRDRPKPMSIIEGRPFLEYLLLKLKKHGLLDVIICSGYKGSLIQDRFGTGELWGLGLKYSQEKEQRGTGGAVKLAQELIKGDDFLLMNGDSFFDIDLNVLIQHRREKNCLATIALVTVENAKRFGTVKINERGEILKFEEKGEETRAGLVNAGIYAFHKRVLSLIPEGRMVSLEHEIFPKLIGMGLYGVAFKSYFVDIGVPEDYLKLQADPSRLVAGVA